MLRSGSAFIIVNNPVPLWIMQLSESLSRKNSLLRSIKCITDVQEAKLLMWPLYKLFLGVNTIFGDPRVR